uniref:hypothetical protein n=1 Tax=Streptococcus pluranimalium TaxID=82348 RepID=UPI003F6937C6
MNPKLVLVELQDCSPDTLIGGSVGTILPWKIGYNTMLLFQEYFNDDCIVTAAHLRFLAKLAIERYSA